MFSETDMTPLELTNEIEKMLSKITLLLPIDFFMTSTKFNE
jgi:hypothetical protein